jgi:hypothetical protein
VAQFLNQLFRNVPVPVDLVTVYPSAHKDSQSIEKYGGSLFFLFVRFRVIAV